MTLGMVPLDSRQATQDFASAPLPFFREAGRGPGVVCLHASASTSSQWRPLMDSFAPRFRVLAPDLLGAGRSRAWPRDRHVSLQDGVALLEPVFARAGDPCVVVAHSYGAAVALIAAVAQPRRFRALAVYEPTLFALLDAKTSAAERCRLLPRRAASRRHRARCRLRAAMREGVSTRADESGLGSDRVCGNSPVL